jgi:predicted nucleic acid-binding protein
MFLLDTVTLSELRRRQRDAGVVAWFARQRTTELFLSVISIGEIERGIARQQAADSGFARSLAAWLDRILALYNDRVLPFDVSTARRWGILSAALGNESTDLMVAATALEHGLTVVTRNVSDFEPTGVAVLNPFGQPQGRNR